MFSEELQISVAIFAFSFQLEEEMNARHEEIGLLKLSLGSSRTFLIL